MLDPRIYRAALLPVLLALLVVAFSLDGRPHAIGTTVSADAFDEKAAVTLLNDWVKRFPDRRAGSPQDGLLAQDIATKLRAALKLKQNPGGAPAVQMQHFSGPTLDGDADLVNVIATRPGAPGPGIVVLAHRDAAHPRSAAELSGTAAMLELASVVGDGRLRRTITFVSTSGGSGGDAGARAVISKLPGPVDAVLVLGDLGGSRLHKPFLTSFSTGRGMTPLQLRQTVAGALRQRIGSDPGGSRATTQWAREAFPITTGEQGALLKPGLPAVLISVSGERGPKASDKILPKRLRAFGRGVLSSIFALDNGPSLPTNVHEYVVTQRKVLPAWAIRLLGIALLGPVLLCALDGLARARRRSQPIGRAMLWTLATAFPFALTAAIAVLFAGVGLIDPAPPAALPATSIELDGAVTAALIALLLVFALCWAGLRPLALRVAGVDRKTPEESGIAAACATLVTLSLAALVIWCVSPLAAVLLAPAAHLWMIAVTPDWRIPRPARLALIALGIVPFVVVALLDASSLGYGLTAAVWQAVLLVAGGAFGPVTWLVWSVIAGCAVCAVRVALKNTPPAEKPRAPDKTVRGPGSYAGPGSLGGTESALRR